MGEVTIRAMDRPGDLGWVLMTHGERYAAEYGWDVEEVTARIVSDHAAARRRGRDAGWIAELDDVRVGSVPVRPRGRADRPPAPAARRPRGPRARRRTPPGDVLRRRRPRRGPQPARALDERTPRRGAAPLPRRRLRAHRRGAAPSSATSSTASRTPSTSPRSGDRRRYTDAQRQRRHFADKSLTLSLGPALILNQRVGQPRR
jgi:hypothetical protein